MRKHNFGCRAVIAVLSVGLMAGLAPDLSVAADPETDPPGTSTPDNSRQPFNLEVRLATYADAFVAGDGDDDINLAGRFDAKMSIDGGAAGLWEGLFINAHFEFVGGDDINTAGDGTIWPVNTHTALPRLSGDNANLALTVTQVFNQYFRATVGKFNLVEAADGTPLVGSGGRGGFNQITFVAPPSFVAPPYILGGQFALTTDPVNYSLLIYDARNAQDSDVFTDPFSEGVVINASATLKTRFGGLPGFYTANYVHSTADGLDFDSLLFEPDTDGFASNIRGYDYVAFKVQQYLHVHPEIPGNGWGIFGQVAFGDDNPHPLGMAYMVGLGGNSPLPGREQDRWGVAFSKYDWSERLVAGLAAIGTDIEDETVIEAFYEAAITDNFRVGANVQYIDPGVVGFDDAVLVGTRARFVY